MHVRCVHCTSTWKYINWFDSCEDCRTLKKTWKICSLLYNGPVKHIKYIEKILSTPHDVFVIWLNVFRICIYNIHMYETHIQLLYTGYQNKRISMDPLDQIENTLTSHYNQLIKWNFLFQRIKSNIERMNERTHARTNQTQTRIIDFGAVSRFSVKFIWFFCCSL